MGWDGAQPRVLARGGRAARCLPPFCSHLHIFSFFFAILNILQDEGFEAGESILHVAEEPAGRLARSPGTICTGNPKVFCFYFLMQMYL